MNNKLFKQLNAVMILLVIASASYFVPVNHANAGLLDWFSGTENQASISQAFNSLANFLSMNDRITNTEAEKQNLLLLQSNSLLSVSSPSVIEIAGKADYAVIKNAMTVFVTAYSSTPDQTDSTPFITAMGTQVRDGIVAANFLPFGTKIRLPGIYGDKIFVVEDRMNRRYWHMVDVWFPDRDSAKEFGVKRATIQILGS